MVVTIETTIRELLDDSAADALVLYDRITAEVLASVGSITRPEQEAARASAQIEEAEGLRRQVGEDEFGLIFHQNDQENRYVATVGSHFILLVLFGDSTSIGRIRLAIKKHRQNLSAVLPVN